MKRPSVIIGVSVLACAGVIGVVAHFIGPDGHDFYAKNIRASLFSGCLTLGSFLLAVNTFIIVNLKKEVYDNDLYKKRVEKHREDVPDYEHYRPLRNLSRVLFVTITAAFASAMLQLTLGILWTDKLSAVICVASSVLVGGGVAVVLVLVATTMRDWFEFLEEATKPAGTGEVPSGEPTGESK